MIAVGPAMPSHSLLLVNCTPDDMHDAMIGPAATSVKTLGTNQSSQEEARVMALTLSTEHALRYV